MVRKGQSLHSNLHSTPISCLYQGHLRITSLEKRGGVGEQDRKGDLLSGMGRTFTKTTEIAVYKILSTEPGP